MKPNAADSRIRMDAAWLGIASGIIGLLALSSLMAAVTARTTWMISSHVALFFRAHDIGVIFQFLLIVPLPIELRRLSHRNSSGLSRNSVVFGVGAISLVAVLLTLGTLRIVNDMFYMLPQGCFGAWLVLANSRLRGILPPWLRYFGIVVGAGLILVGTVFPGLATFVYPSMWKIPAVSVDNDTFQDSAVNRLFHLFLYAGSLLGVVTLPLWTITTGWMLFENKDLPRPT